MPNPERVFLRVLHRRSFFPTLLSLLRLVPLAVLLAGLLTSCDLGGRSAEGVGITNVSQAAPRLLDHNEAGDYTPYFATGDLNRPRYLHESLILQSGQPLILGGSDERGFSGINNVEIFDQSTFAKDVPRPASLTGLWVDTNFEGDPISFENGARMLFTADLLGDGRVLVAGGSSDLLGGEIQGSAELFDPQTRKFTAVEEDMDQPRFRHVSVPLNDGSILFIGGQIQSSVTIILPNVQGPGGAGAQIQVTVFNSVPESEVFSPTETKFLPLNIPGTDKPVKLNTPRGRTGHAVSKMAGPDSILNSSDDVLVIAGGFQSLTGQFSPQDKLPGDVGFGRADGITSIEFFDPQTKIFTQVSNVSLFGPRVNKPYIVNLGQFNDFTPDGVQGMGNMVLITHGNTDAACPETELVDELLVANFTGFGPAQGLQFFAVEDPTNNSHVQGIEYPRPPDFVGRCGSNPVALPRRLVTAPGVGEVETWVFALAGVDIFLTPAGCVQNTISPTMRAGCVFDPFYSLAASDLGLSPRDLQSQRSRNNPLGVIGTWLTLDGQIPTTDRSLFGNTTSRTRWGRMVASARIWHRAIPIAGVDGVLNTPDDRILLAGGGTSYGVGFIDVGGEPTAPSAEIFLPPNVNSEKPSP